MMTTIIPKRCCICGKPFGVKLNKKGKILTDCWHNYLDLNYFNGWTYELKEFGTDKDIITKLKFKNLFYKLTGFCGFTRWIVYNLWYIFHKKAIFEIWECPKCANRKDD